MAKRGGLGRGLDAIFPVKPTTESTPETNEVKNAENKAINDKKEAAEKNPKAASSQSTATKSTTAKPAVTKSSATKSSVTKSSETKLSTAKSSATKSAATKANTTKSGAVKADAQMQAASPVQNPETITMSQQATELPQIAEESDKNAEVLMKISKIEPNRDQPRKDFDEDALQELAESIKNHGLIQPIIVRTKGSQYEIVAGERRWRAARLAGLKEVPVIIKDYTDSEVAEIALIENLQRENLNPIEEALAYQKLLSVYDLTQEEVAFRVSKSRSVITNSLRLLRLPEQVQSMISEGVISTGHGKVLLSLDTDEQKTVLANQIIEERLSVRQTEERVHAMLNPKPEKEKVVLGNEVIYKDIEKKLCLKINSKVQIHRTNEKKGRIEIAYASPEDLERIVELLGIQI